MWVLCDLSVSAARPRAIFLIRSFAQIAPAIVQSSRITCTVSCVIGSSITPPNGGSRQSPSSRVYRLVDLYTDSAIRDGAKGNLRQDILHQSRDIAYISKKSHVGDKENTGYPENTFNHRYNIFVLIIICLLKNILVIQFRFL